MEEFIFLLDADDFLLADVLDLEVNKDEEKNIWTLSSTISGDNASNYRFSNDVKAVTFNDMKIQEDTSNNVVTIQFVLDV
jgi:SHS2 domain-containing protein